MFFFLFWFCCYCFGPLLSYLLCYYHSSACVSAYVLGFAYLSVCVSPYVSVAVTACLLPVVYLSVCLCALICVLFLGLYVFMCVNICVCMCVFEWAAYLHVFVYMWVYICMCMSTCVMPCNIQTGKIYAFEMARPGCILNGDKTWSCNRFFSSIRAFSWYMPRQ